MMTDFLSMCPCHSSQTSHPASDLYDFSHPLECTCLLPITKWKWLKYNWNQAEPTGTPWRRENLALFFFCCGFTLGKLLMSFIWASSLWLHMKLWLQSNKFSKEDRKETKISFPSLRAQESLSRWCKNQRWKMTTRKKILLLTAVQLHGQTL